MTPSKCRWCGEILVVGGRQYAPYTVFQDVDVIKGISGTSYLCGSCTNRILEAIDHSRDQALVVDAIKRIHVKPNWLMNYDSTAWGTGAQTWLANCDQRVSGRTGPRWEDSKLVDETPPQENQDE